MRILLTDLMFPNKYAKWRLVEICSFINNFETDILIINRIDNCNKVKYEFDFDYLKEKFNLNKYNILIFDPKYNYINKYNNNFDGIKFNNKLPISYVLQLKKYKNEEFNINNYDKIYHIFLLNFYDFNKKFNYPTNKQFIHLYPGGNLDNEQSLKKLNDNVPLIVTQNFIHTFLNNLNKQNKRLLLYGAPYLYQNEIIKNKKINNDNLTVCFTSLGGIKRKGSHIYKKIVKKFYKKYPKNNINFISIGNARRHENIKHFSYMPQDKLSKFYYDNVDILINLEIGVDLNGFPLGVEGALQGCLLLTTDAHNQNKNNNFNFDDFIIINKNNIDSIIKKIKLLDDDREKLFKLSSEIQNKMYNLFNYKNHMLKIIEFVKKN